MKNNIFKTHCPHALAMLSMAAAIALLVGTSLPAVAAPAAPTPISQVPLTIAVPAHPQIMVAIANSESMDGNLSGAIMTGSGSIAASANGLNASSSPVNFPIPIGFTPPLNAGGGGVAPYTVNVAGTLYDNSPSRLNVAKAGISAILTSYMVSADFALMNYDTTGNGLYGTWVYQMSPPGGFTFTSVPAASGQVPNPCFGINIFGANSVQQDCAVLNGFYAAQNIVFKQYMNISASSDDPSINDVLYDGGGPGPICIAYSAVAPNPVNPFPPHFTLAQFNAGGTTVSETYASNKNSCPQTTYPTNAGFVGYSTQVMYEQRGFGYGANQSATTGTVLVPMTTAGATPTAGTVTTALAAFAPYLKPETNNVGTTEIKASAGQSPIAGIVSKAGTYFATNPGSSNGCTPLRYLVLVTDGLPTEDLAGRSWPPLGSAAGAGYGVTAAFNGDGSLNTSLAVTNDQALLDAIAKLTALNSGGNPVKTYIIGLGAGVDPSKNPVAAQTLTAMAIAGGTGSYFAATDPTTLTNDLQSILGSILAATQSVASVAVNSTGLSTNTVVYQSQFLSSDTYQDWTGNLYAFPVNALTGVVDTVPADAIWAAATQLDAQSWDTGRLIAAWDPIAGAATPFRWTAGTPATGIANTTTLGQDLTTFAPDPSGQDALNYLRGSNAQEVRNGGQFRNRTHKLGDIVFSNPAYVGPPAGSIVSPSYAAFAVAQKSRPPVLYVGANDGMLHAFDAATGDERFAYIPTGVYANLINLVSPYYNGRHLFYVDGSPQYTDMQFANNTWHTMLFGTEAAGGKSIFAMDITDPTTLTSEAAVSAAVKWDFTNTDLGLTYAIPALANTNNGLMLFEGNGYDSTNEKPFLFVLNPQTGALFAKVDLCAAVPTACNLAVANGLSSAIAVNTGGQGTAAANIVYAGDLQGNLWRVDISNSLPAAWSVSVLLKAKDSLGNAQPITTAPVVTLNPQYPQLLGTFVFVGTGELLGLPDLSTTNVQTIYGVYDPPTAYATPLLRANLVQQTLSAGLIGTTVVATVTNNAVSVPTTKGWYIDLSLNAGERVVNNPLLRSGALLITTTQPATSACSSGGAAFLYVINYATGSSFATPQFDANGDGTINSGDTTSTGKVPLSVELGYGFYADSTPVNQGNPGGVGPPGNVCPLGDYEVYNCPESGATCTPRCMKGSGKRRIGWWEVKQ